MRLDNLEQDIRTTTGSLEQLGNNIRQLKDRLDRLVSDIDFRLSSYDEKLSGGRTTSLKSLILPSGNVLPSSSSAVDLEAIASNSEPVNATGQVAPDSEKAERVLGTVAAKEVSAIRERTGSSPVNSTSINSDKLLEQKPLQVLLPAGKPKEQYTFALNLLRQTKYGQAKVALTQFIALRPKHPLAGNARYWLGETFYVQADYEQAAQTFFKSYRESPTNAKAPDMLLKLGMSLSRLKKPKEACATFEKLTKDFPSASTRIISAVTRERKRARC